ncbi:MAG TPA: alpha-ribazole phosphatase [Xylanibacter oryzae]|nr:alpha-ribazole phosphatase [Xylanibacter oryzae]
MEIVLIRHTKVGVPKGTCYGWSDVPLADTFLEEAAETKANLEKIKMNFDKVYSSPLSRAEKLAEYCGYPDAERDDRLKEMNMGDWEMQKYDEIQDEALQLWFNDYMHLAATNGESFPIMYARVAAFLDELKKKSYKKVAIFAHGGVLICAGVYGGLFPAEDCFSHLTTYGGIETITI